MVEGGSLFCLLANVLIFISVASYSTAFVVLVSFSKIVIFWENRKNVCGIRTSYTQATRSVINISHFVHGFSRIFHIKIRTKISIYLYTCINIEFELKRTEISSAYTEPPHCLTLTGNFLSTTCNKTDRCNYFKIEKHMI